VGRKVVPYVIQLLVDLIAQLVGIKVVAEVMGSNLV